MAQPSNADLETLIRQQNNEVEKLRDTVEELKSMMKELMQQNLLQKSARISFPVEPNARPRNRRSSERMLHRDPNKTFLLRNVPFSEVEEACHRWSDILGVGGFGEVYKGTWNGQNVAVKRLRNDKRPIDIKGVGDEAYNKFIEQTFKELEVLHCYPAENILPLLGFSYDEFLRTDPCLIYLHMGNGSVLDRLVQKYGTPPLTWDQRANIALGTARGLTHLHANKIKHGDIKSGNVLLDKYFEPKIGDFGLARGGSDLDNTHITLSMIVGTKHYLPEDFMRNGQLGPEVDTFSYGILLFELVSGKGPSIKVGNSTVREIMLNPNNEDLETSMVDRNYGEMEVLPDPMQSKWPLCLYRLGKDCTKNRRKDRPPMSKVFSALDFLHKHPSLQDKAVKEKEEEESCMMVQFPVPIPTILNDEQQSSVGITFNARSSPDSRNSDLMESSDDRSRSELQKIPSNKNPILHKNRKYQNSELHLYDEGLPNISGHIRNIYAFT